MLPYGLLDLTVQRLALPNGASRLCRRGFSLSRAWRNAETVSTPPVATAFVSKLPEGSGRKKKSLAGVRIQPLDVPVALRELDERIRALETVVDSEETDALVHETSYSEQELAIFYQDVLANPLEGDSELHADENDVRKARDDEDVALVEALYERFDVDNTASTSARPYLTIISRLESIVTRLEETQRIGDPESPNQEQQFFPVGILTPRECEALVRVSINSKDIESAEITLDLMKRTGLSVPDQAVTDILQMYTNNGNVAEVDNTIARFAPKPAEDHRHLHIQAHIKATPPRAIPTVALELLHHYENRGIPAPMETYTSLIASLFSRPSSIARGQAWDLFSHMRYVAHPDPDVPLYTLMIRACASPIQSSLRSEPEKALDLWTEMTVDHRLTPTIDAYNAIILACSRTGTKEFVSEAFRIARQMLDSHRDAQGFSAYRPDRKTFCALLEGAKRLGDLGRVRWILAEMTRNTEDATNANGPVNAEVDEEVMLHVFHAYAAYKPPFLKSITKIVEEDSPAAGGAQETTTASGSREPSEITDPGTDTAPSFAHIPPQTHDEVVQEVHFLFHCIREAQNGSSVDVHESEEAAISLAKFKNVAITPYLVNAYMSVLYNHASLSACRDVFWSIYGALKVTRSVRAYVEALERCAIAKKNRDGGLERQNALQFAEELWKDWSVMEMHGEHAGQKLDARMVERATGAMIRVFALNEQVDRALELVRAFSKRYDPSAVRERAPKPFLRSTKTVLVGAKPLVRMTSATEVPDDFVPPMLLFKDVEVLHHRLVAKRRHKDVGYLKWVCKAYEWALRVRRDESFRDHPKAPISQLPVALNRQSST
ncbi:hypothetical protein FA15DRAFT_664477 [Coprinopsis marcescibilis]|uniref:Uncharacterized protein n=1 Tax=Coprinopsis marcescibilis TaxID=230819 RepID=A0A5C3LAV0_COPMA|nr:hypothetical protein FA15DRAFT_664477 [Coprinopsis marcescibilis]